MFILIPTCGLTFDIGSGSSDTAIQIFYKMAEGFPLGYIDHLANRVKDALIGVFQTEADLNETDVHELNTEVINADKLNL